MVSDRKAIRSAWLRAGVAFTGVKPARHETLIEALLACTSLVGRHEPRLIYGMASWLAVHGDLLNIFVLRRSIPESDSAVLAACIEVAVRAGADKRLLRVLDSCEPKAEPELLFHTSADLVSHRIQTLTNSDPLCAKWNVYCREIPVKRDAVLNRDYVLRHNPHLGRRALLGISMRSAILEALTTEEGLSVAALTARIGCEYPAVHNEVKRLERDRMLKSRKVGRLRLVSLRPRLRDYLRRIPV